MPDGRLALLPGPRKPAYAGQPYLVDEFGGIKWIPPRREALDAKLPGATAKGRRPWTSSTRGWRAWSTRSSASTTSAGYCYTQLTDVEQEQNGIYNYDRTAKFDMERIAAIFSKTR